MKLNDICEVYSGYALKEFNNNSNGFPVIKIGNIIADGSIALDDCQFTTEIVNEKYYSRYGDIYVALSGATTGKIGIMQTNQKHIVNQRVGIVRKKNNDFPDAFIKYFLIHQTDRILQEASGCAQPNISPKQIALYEIPEIKHKEILKFVNTLDNITNIIKLRQQQLTKLDELVKARFVEMFGDIIANSKKWDVMLWSDVLTIKNGRNQKQVENPNGKYPICGSGGTMGYADDYITNENSVIVGRKGNINKPILMRERFWNVDTAFGLEPNTDTLSVDYLYLYCLFFNFESLNKAVTIPSLTKAGLLNIDMPIPPIDLQKQFAAFVEQVDKSKFAVQKALDEAQTLFDSLMQQYFG